MGEASGLSALADPLRDPEATLRAVTEGASDRVWAPLRAEPGIGETVFRGYAAVVAVIIHERIMGLRAAGQGLDELTDTTLMAEVLSFPGSTTMHVPWLGSIPPCRRGKRNPPPVQGHGKHGLHAPFRG